MASVPTGMPPGIWTIDSRLSIPLRELASIGTPNTGSGVMRRSHAGQMRRTARPGDDDLQPALPGARRKLIKPLRRPVSRNDARLERDA